METLTGEPVPDTIVAHLNVKGSWQHGVFAVPAVPPAAYPLTAALMQSPYPWGELHITCNSFVALPPTEAAAIAAAIAALPSPTIAPLAIAHKVGWRTNLVLRASSPDLEALRHTFPDAKRCFSRDVAKPVALKATLQYGVTASTQAPPHWPHHNSISQGCR